MVDVLKVKKLTSDAVVPSRGTDQSAGLDLCCNESNVVIPSNTCMKISTGLAMAIPTGYVGLIFARSGISVKKGLRPANAVGVIDSDYRGEIIVPLYNDSNVDQCISKGDRIAQMVIVPFASFDIHECSYLDTTDRGCGGFGSTGE